MSRHIIGLLEQKAHTKLDKSYYPNGPGPLNQVCQSKLMFITNLPNWGTKQFELYVTNPFHKSKIIKSIKVYNDIYIYIGIVSLSYGIKEKISPISCNRII